MTQGIKTNLNLHVPQDTPC